jgi:hypothetical protein
MLSVAKTNLSIFPFFPGEGVSSSTSGQGRKIRRKQMDVSVNSEEENPYFDDLRKHVSHVRGGPVSDEEIIAMISAIDPKTCEVDWGYGETLDPYGVVGVRPEESCVGREYWARSPGSDVWINFVSLPRNVSDALMEKHRKEIMFPAGLFV